MDNTHSVKTITAKPTKDAGYGGTPGAPAFRIGKQQQQDKEGAESINVDSDKVDSASSSGLSSGDLSGLSRDELIKRLQHARLSSNSTGSAPKNRTRSHPKDAT